MQSKFGKRLYGFHKIRIEIILTLRTKVFKSDLKNIMHTEASKQYIMHAQASKQYIMNAQASKQYIHTAPLHNPPN